MFGILKFKKIINYDFEFDLSAELGEPPEILKWRVGCLCTDCNKLREESLQNM